MKAVLAAFLAFLLTVGLGHIYARNGVCREPEDYALWASEEKSRSLAGLKGCLTEQSLLVFGSSEFLHAGEEPSHPSRIFKGSSVTPVLVGAGYYQSLSHAVTLAALAPEMPMKKAVLLLSPQWFRKTGVVDQAYTSRFSEVLYDEMLENERITEETRTYISKRTHLLLKPDEATRKRVKRDEDYLWKQTLQGPAGLVEGLWLSFLEEKDAFGITLSQDISRLFGRRKSATGAEDEAVRQGNEPDWEALYALEVKKGEEEDENPFYIGQDSYKRLEPHLKTKKGMNVDAKKGYQGGPEFDDLACFLTVCKETGIQPMIVLVPVNGYYYDYTEFPASARAAYYEKIRKLAKEHGAQVADFSGEEYTPYFFEDRVHLGKVGWCKVSEAIYRFGLGTKEEVP